MSDASKPPVPLVGADPTPMTRKDVIDSIREIYADWRIMDARINGNTNTSLPDFEAMIDYVEKYGLPEN